MNDKQRLLTASASLDTRWNEAATDMVREDWELAAQANHYGLKLADAVVSGRLSVDDLRDFVTWANDLDREVVEVSKGEIEALSAADHHEALARRIAHHSGRTALSLVGTKQKLQTHQVRYRGRVELLRSDTTRGLFQVEAKDVGL